MNLILFGATGFIGQALIPALLARGDQLTMISRDPSKVKNPGVKALSWEQLSSLSPESFDAAINLVGEGIADKRWTQGRKQELIESRTLTTQTIGHWLGKAEVKKSHLYNASAVGIYGAHLNAAQGENYSETTTLPETAQDFCSQLVRLWEEATQSATEANIPVTLMRFGVVLKRKEGMLKKLELPYKLALGSTLGGGQQALAWIHVEDLVAAIIFLLDHPQILGPVNLCAPQLITQQTFAKAFAKALKRPMFLDTPAFVIKAMFGQMGEELLLSGQNVVPEVLTREGFEFRFNELEKALT